MPRYILTAQAFHDGRMHEAGEEIDLPATVAPGPHMTPAPGDGEAATLYARAQRSWHPDFNPGVRSLPAETLKEERHALSSKEQKDNG